MTSRAIILLPLMAVLTTVGARAVDIPKLCGSDVLIENAIAKSNAVFEGKVTELGDESTPCNGRTSLYGVVRVLNVLRGQLGADEFVWMDVYLTLDQEPPKMGGSYIFCVTKTHSQTISYPSPVLKMLSATDDNIALAKKLISN